MGWLADTFIGKIDRSPIYTDMPDSRKRKKQWCVEWQEKHVRELKSKLDMQANATRNAKIGERNERLKRQIYLFIKLKVNEFYSPYCALPTDLENLDRRIVRAVLDYVHDDISPEGDFWKTVLRMVEDDPSLRPYVPSLFDGRHAATWKEERQKRQEQEAIQRKRDEAIKSGTVTKYRVAGRMYQRIVGRFTAMRVPNSEKDLKYSSDNWEVLNRWLDEPDWGMEGTLFVTIDGVGEISVGRFQNSFTGGVSFDWTTAWRPA